MAAVRRKSWEKPSFAPPPDGLSSDNADRVIRNLRSSLDAASVSVFSDAQAADVKQLAEAIVQLKLTLRKPDTSSTTKCGPEPVQATPATAETATGSLEDEQDTDQIPNVPSLVLTMLIHSAIIATNLMLLHEAVTGGPCRPGCGLRRPPPAPPAPRA